MKIRWLLASISSLALAACSSSTTGGGSGEGGAQTTGGATSSGGAQTTGGSATTGGATGNGGAISSGGAATTGGATSVGGATTQLTTGGRASSGGTPGSGGAVGSGGTTTPDAGATGGSAKTGGSTGTGSGGATSTGGTTKSGTGGQASGGTTATTGGSTASSGGNTTLQALVKTMSPGWNLGNSFDGSPNVTSWGNPAPNQTLINAVHTAGFNTLRLPVTWTNHIGAAPNYTIDATWMASVVQTAQWAVDAGMFVFVNTHHEADGNGGWVTFPATTAAAQTVADEVTLVWGQIATAFKAFNSHLMLECFNEPNEAGGGNTPQAQTDLNMYLEACFKAIRDTGGANATRIVMIQPVGASPIQSGIQSMQKVSFINDPNLIISLHTYYPTNFGLNSSTQVSWGTSAADYTNMENSITHQIRVWLPTQPIVIGEWGSMGEQATATRAAHALAYAQDTTTAGLVPIWWDNGGAGTGSFAIFNRTTGAITEPTIVSGIMTGVKNGLVAPNTWATLTNP